MLNYYVKITNDVDLSVLQAAINALCQWADAWQLSISVEKSCVLCIGKTVTSTPMSINGASLPYVSSCPDLGVTDTSDLTPSVHINDIVFKAHQRANAIHRCFTLRNTDLLVRAYCVYVRPLLEYSSVIWFPHLKCDIEATEEFRGDSLSVFLATTSTVSVYGYYSCPASKLDVFRMI